MWLSCVLRKVICDAIDCLLYTLPIAVSSCHASCVSHGLLGLQVVYHPSAGNGHAFANVGFVGWIGALSGQSSAHMAISEIGTLVLPVFACRVCNWKPLCVAGVAFPDSTFGAESRSGIPFTFLLRDILQV